MYHRTGSLETDLGWLAEELAHTPELTLIYVPTHAIAEHVSGGGNNFSCTLIIGFIPLMTP